jgi:hypothetical protein
MPLVVVTLLPSGRQVPPDVEQSDTVEAVRRKIDGKLALPSLQLVQNAQNDVAGLGRREPAGRARSRRCGRQAPPAATRGHKAADSDRQHRLLVPVSGSDYCMPPGALLSLILIIQIAPPADH